MAPTDYRPIYQANSPYYRQVVDTFGYFLTAEEAERIAEDHETSLSALGIHGAIDTIDLLMELGY